MKIQIPEKNRNVRRKQAGFTLVEMLLVLVILGVLAAIVYPRVAGRGEQARVTAAQTQIGAFKTVLDLFEADNGYYPKGRNGLQDLLVKPRDATNCGDLISTAFPRIPGATIIFTSARANITRLPTT